MSFMRTIEGWAEPVKDFKMPDIAGMDGDIVQLAVIILVGLWLFSKLKSLFFFFLIIVGLYYMMYLV